MSGWVRLTGLAVFCCLWGFIGSIAGIYALGHQTKGDPGPPGPRGEAGAQGPAGPRGPIMHTSSTKFGRDVDAQLRALHRRVAALESSGPDGDGGCNRYPVQVVTDVRLNTFGSPPRIDTRTVTMCSNFP